MATGDIVIAAVATRWEDHIRGIREDPDSDAPRLVCADWLLDRGDVRGDYIALACRHNAMPGGTAEAWEVWDQLIQFRELETQWLRQLMKLGALQWEFARGFVDGVAIAGAAAGNFSAMCRLEPIIELTIVDSDRYGCSVLADAPELAELRCLAFYDQQPNGCEALLASPFLVNLHELRVAVTPWSIAAIANGTVRPKRPRIFGRDDGDFAALVAAGFYERAEELEVFRATESTLLELARTPLAHLRRIRLSEGKLTVRAFEALGPRLDQIEHLSFLSTPIDRDIATVLSKHMPSGNLRSLFYEGGDGRDELDPFFSSPAFRGVEELTLRGRFNLTALERSTYRGKLRKLVVGKLEYVRFVDLPGVEIRGYFDGR